MEIWIWLGVTVISLIVEFITFDLASIWFAAGGIVAMIIASMCIFFIINKDCIV